MTPARGQYHRYLNSWHWRIMRQIKLWLSGHKCQLCASRHRLEVHHNTYERVGRESLNDLVVLCRQCHQKYHNKL